MIGQEPQGKDRRIHKRIPALFSLMFSVKAPFEVHVQFGGRNMDAIAQDICEGGVGMLTNDAIPIGTRVSVTFKIFNQSENTGRGNYRVFELLGDVRYSMLTKDTDYRLGVQFVNTTEEDRQFIKNYVQDNKLKPSQSKLAGRE